VYSSYTQAFTLKAYLFTSTSTPQVTALTDNSEVTDTLTAGVYNYYIYTVTSISIIVRYCLERVSTNLSSINMQVDKGSSYASYINFYVAGPGSRATTASYSYQGTHNGNGNFSLVFKPSTTGAYSIAVYSAYYSLAYSLSALSGKVLLPV
jgi:hypothetical protein